MLMRVPELYSVLYLIKYTSVDQFSSFPLRTTFGSLFLLLLDSIRPLQRVSGPLGQALGPGQFDYNYPDQPVRP